MQSLPQINTGLIGSGIQASGSPMLHMAEAAELGLNLHYQLYDLDLRPGGVADLPRVIAEVEQAGFAGVNITHPCKQAVLQHVHELSPDAAALGAVNTLVFANGRRVGHNTDWWGFAEGFRRALPGSVQRVVTQLGAGGAGSAVAYAMLKMGTQRLNVYDVDRARAAQLHETLAKSFDAQRVKLVETLPDALAASDGLINTTPVGMAKYPGTPLPPELLRAEMWVAEIVYFPLETELLRAARGLGCRTVDGGGMVVFQAAEAFRLFTGVEPDSARMLERFRGALRP
jgi:shikimate dehydrogenase